MWATARSFKEVKACLQNSKKSEQTSKINQRSPIKVGSTDDHQALVKPVAKSNRERNSKSDSEVAEHTVTDTSAMLASSVGHTRRIPVLSRKTEYWLVRHPCMFLAGVTAAGLRLWHKKAPVSNSIQHVATDETRSVVEESVPREISRRRDSQIARQPELQKKRVPTSKSRAE